MRVMLKSKLSGLKVTDVNLHYDGSISIDSTLLHKANIAEYEQVHVLNVTNGNRLTTYAMMGKEDEVCVNGAASHLVKFGDEIVVLAYSIGVREVGDDTFKPIIIKCG